MSRVRQADKTEIDQALLAICLLHAALEMIAL